MPVASWKLSSRNGRNRQRIAAKGRFLDPAMLAFGTRHGQPGGHDQVESERADEQVRELVRPYDREIIREQSHGQHRDHENCAGPAVERAALGRAERDNAREKGNSPGADVQGERRDRCR